MAPAVQEKESTENANRPNEEAALRLASLDDSESHRLWLKEWKREAKFLETDYDRKLASSRRSKSDLVTILGVQFAFQGLLVSGIAPSQTIGCRHFLIVCLLSAIASLATLLATLRKLKEMAHNKERLNSQIKQMTWQNHHIKQLREKGENYSFELVEPFDLGVSDISGKGLHQRLAAQARILLGFWVWSHSGAILALSLMFSGGILVGIKFLMCS